MALESKPLFHPEVIHQQVRSFSLPERVADWQPKLQHWASLSDLVNQAYALTPAEIDLMWKTAPPRMPIPAPAT